ncbi:MAG: metallophosphoesterase [Bacteroides sp.]|nr:metallophosphoesterase [Bacteroides sp.]
MSLFECLRSLKVIPEVQYVAELLLNADRKEGEMTVLYESWDEMDGKRVDWSKSTEPEDTEISDIKTEYIEDNDPDFVHRIVGMPEISLNYYPMGSRDWHLTLWMDIPNIPEMEDTPSLYSLFLQSRFAPLFRYISEVGEGEIVSVCIDMGCDINDAAKLISYYIRYYECDKEDKKYNIGVWWDGCDKEENKEDVLMKKDILIIPDVHGRRFWKEAVEAYPDADIIFLGDYHDPYPDEGISEQESLENFKEIVEYAKTHRNCQLLLGNHDLHYICNFGEACRLDYANSAAIHHLLYDNLWLFKIADLRRVGDKTVLFSHAPVLVDWIQEVGETTNAELLVKRLNSLLPTVFMKPWETEDMLTHTSFYRGGFGNFGSPIWADMQEIDKNIIPTVDFSIFGHTKRPEAVITDTWANLDCRRAFLLNSYLELTGVWTVSSKP